MSARQPHPVLTLRLPTTDDATELYALADASRERLRAWLPWVDATRSAADSLAFIEDSLAAHEAGSRYTWLIDVDGRIAGACDLHELSRQNRRAAIGYWLGDGYVGRGLLQQALPLLLAESFGPLGLHRVVIDAAAANVRSCAVAERAGFRFEGVLRDYLYLNERYWDAHQYSLLANEWKPEA